MCEAQAGPDARGPGGERGRGARDGLGPGDGGSGAPGAPGPAPPGRPQSRAKTALCNSSAAGAVTRKVVATETKPPQTPLSLTGKDGARSTFAAPGAGLRQPGSSGSSSSSELRLCLAPFVVLSCYRAQVG